MRGSGDESWSMLLPLTRDYVAPSPRKEQGEGTSRETCVPNKFVLVPKEKPALDFSRAGFDFLSHIS